MEKELINEQKGLPFASYIKEFLNLPDTDIKSYSPLTLAYIGDSIYDLVIRTAVVENGNAPVNKLHKSATKLVQATAQADIYFMIREQLTEEEMAVFKRGRNAKSFTSAKNASISEYRIATGLEALLGYLYLTDQTGRMMELIQSGLNKKLGTYESKGEET
jgi:ribonuclease-3 family protein